ncbi:MAG: ATP-binding cassette domain-containing protein, partial [Eggerthellaceae bacterium]|nr:ATP-binding cassette domain-containing protein [Eggerthellaceae bacterium]
LILVPEYFRPIREFAADYHASLDGRSAFAAIRAVRRKAEDELSVASSQPANSGEEVVCADASLTMRNVGYSYPDFPQALRDVSFSVQSPCKVGVIGASGSGKSTLLSILGGFEHPASGSIELNGCPVDSLRLPAWQKRATFIPQDPYLFHATLRENVTFYQPESTEEEVLRAIRLAGLEEVVAHLPEGLDTLVGQGGRALSGGQAHRVALARAFLDPSRSVLLFDEPTAHLDIETELELKERMLPLMEGRLVFFATHRLHWVENMDYILEMKAGRVVWQGPSEEWLAQRGACTRNDAAVDAPNGVACDASGFAVADASAAGGAR